MLNHLSLKEHSHSKAIAIVGNKPRITAGFRYLYVKLNVHNELLIKLITLTVQLSSYAINTSAQSETNANAFGRQTANLSEWPKASKMATEEMIKKYGEPDAIVDEILGWSDAGPWKMIHVAIALAKMVDQSYQSV